MNCIRNVFFCVMAGLLVCSCAKDEESNPSTFNSTGNRIQIDDALATSLQIDSARVCIQKVQSSDGSASVIIGKNPCAEENNGVIPTIVEADRIRVFALQPSIPTPENITRWELIHEKIPVGVVYEQKTGETSTYVLKQLCTSGAEDEKYAPTCDVLRSEGVITNVLLKTEIAKKAQDDSRAQVNSITPELEKVQGQVESLKKQLAEDETQAAELKTTFEATLKNHEQLLANKEQAEQQLATASAELVKTERERLAIVTAQAEQSKAQLAALETQVTQAEAAVEAKKKELSQIESEVQRVKAIRDQAQRIAQRRDEQVKIAQQTVEKVEAPKEK